MQRMFFNSCFSSSDLEASKSDKDNFLEKEINNFQVLNNFSGRTYHCVLNETYNTRCILLNALKFNLKIAERKSFSWIISILKNMAHKSFFASINPACSSILCYFLI